ncbi:MAG: hypothetical protein ACK56I_19355, partial [bacterium]
KKVTDTRQQNKKIDNEWAGTNPEIANRLYTDPSLTIAPIPLLLKDYRNLVGHPEVPSVGQAIEVSDSEEGEEGESSEEKNESEEDENNFSSKGRNSGLAGSAMGGSGGVMGP